MEGWLNDKIMPCSCRNDKADIDFGKHLRYFDQEWGKEGSRRYFEWVCSCGKKKPGRNE